MQTNFLSPSDQKFIIIKMFKTIAATAVLQVTQAAISGEFLKGAQTAVFLRDAEDFADYSCPEPEMDESIERYVNMIGPVKMMVGGAKKNKKGTKKAEDMDTNPMIDALDKLEAYGE